MLTRRRVEALKWIAEFIAREGYAPSRAEIGRALLGVTRQQAARFVRALVDDGYLHDSARGHGFERGREISVTPAGLEFVRSMAAHRATAGVET